MFYNLADVQGIRVMVNIGASSSSPNPLETNAPSPTSIVEASTSVSEVD